jgi:hypothetical protein
VGLDRKGLVGLTALPSPCVNHTNSVIFEKCADDRKVFGRDGFNDVVFFVAEGRTDCLLLSTGKSR